MEDSAVGQGGIFFIGRRFQKDSATGEKDRHLSPHSGKERLSVLPLENEDTMDLLFWFSLIFALLILSILLRMGDPFSGTVYIYKRNSAKNRKFPPGIPGNEKKPACVR